MAVEAEKSFCVLVVHEMKLLTTAQRQFRQQNGKILLSKAIRAWYKRFIDNGCVCVCVCVCMCIDLKPTDEGKRHDFCSIFLQQERQCKHNVTFRRVLALIVAL